MRVVRIVVIAAAAIVALVVVGIAALLLFVDPNHYRGDIERIVRERTGRELKLEGKLGLKIFPWLALSVRDVQLGNPPEFGPQPFLTVQNASIGVKLLPLLGKRLEISRIAVDGVAVELVSRGATNNWKDLSEPKGAAAQGPPATSPSGPQSGATASAPMASASIEGVEITHSSLVLRDDVKKSTTALTNLELHTGRVSSGPDGAILEDLVLQGNWLAEPTGGPAAGVPAAAAAVADRAVARGGNSPGAAAAKSDDTQAGPPKPVPFSLRAAKIGFNADTQTLTPAKIEAKLGDTSLLVSVAGEKLSSDRLVTGTLAVPTTSPGQLMQTLGMVPPITRDPHALAAFALQTNFRLTQKQLQLSGLQLTLDDTRVQGSAAVDDLDTMAASFDLNVNAINVDRYRAPEEKAPAPTKPAAAKIPTPLPIEALRKLDVHGNLRVGSVTFAAIVLTDLTTPLVAKDGEIRLGPTQARLYGGTYNGDVILDSRPAEAQLSLNEHLIGTDIAALAKAAVDSTRISGHADANVAVKGVGNTDDALMRSLSGKIDATVKQGALNGIDVTYELQRVNALLKRETPPQHTGPERTVFNTLQTHATLDKGSLRTDDLQIQTDFLKVHGGGTLNLTSEALDYQLVASVNKQPGNAQGTGGLDALKAVDIPLAITGTLSSPTVRPDIAALAKGQLRQQLQQKAGDVVKKNLGNQLKGLLGH